MGIGEKMGIFTDLAEQLYQTGLNVGEGIYHSVHSKVDESGLPERLRSGLDVVLEKIQDQYPDEYEELIGTVQSLLDDPLGTIREGYDRFRGDLPQMILNAPGYLEERLKKSVLSNPTISSLYGGDTEALERDYRTWYQENNVSKVIADAVRRDETDFAYSIGQILLRLLMSRDDVREILQQDPRLARNPLTPEFYRQVLRKFPGALGDIAIELVEDRPKKEYRNEIRRISPLAGGILDVVEKISDYSVFLSNVIMPLNPDERGIRNKGPLKYIFNILSTIPWIVGETLDMLPLYVSTSYWGLNKAFENYAMERATQREEERTTQTAPVESPTHAEQPQNQPQEQQPDLSTISRLLQSLGITPENLMRALGGQQPQPATT